MRFGARGQTWTLAVLVAASACIDDEGTSSSGLTESSGTSGSTSTGVVTTGSSSTTVEDSSTGSGGTTTTTDTGSSSNGSSTGTTGLGPDDVAPSFLVIDAGGSETARASIRFAHSTVAVGTTTVAGSRDVYAVRVDELGDSIWQVRLGGASWDEANAIVPVADLLRVVGRSESFGPVGSVGWIIDLDADGSVVHQSFLHGPGSSYLRAAANVGSSTVVGGSVHTGGNRQAWLAWIDAEGQAVWNQLIGGPETDDLNGVVDTPDGPVFAGETRSYGSGQIDAWIVAVDDSGSVRWQRAIGGNGVDRFEAIAAFGDGVVAVGHTESFGVGGHDLWAVAVDAGGTVLWQRGFGSGGDEFGRVVAVDGDDIVVGGQAESFGDGSQDLWVLGLDLTGNSVWQRRFDVGGNYDSIQSMTATETGWLIAGFTEDNEADMVLVHVEETGDLQDCALISQTASAITNTTAEIFETDATVTPVGSATMPTRAEAESLDGTITRLCGEL